MAVYTSLSDSDLENFLYKFNLGKLLTFKGIAGGVTNSNFFVETEFGNFVLTIFEELSFKDLPFYFDFMKINNFNIILKKILTSISLLSEFACSTIDCIWDDKIDEIIKA
jgi:hypothetical protein